MSFVNPGDEALRELLRRARTVAVVGFSPKSDRPSHGVAAAMQRFGYRIIPVRPMLAEGLGEKAWPDLATIPNPGEIDLVDVFRAPEHVGEIVDACIALKIPALWLQAGVINEGEAMRARAAGLTVVMDRCVYREYARLCGAAPRCAP